MGIKSKSRRAVARKQKRRAEKDARKQLYLAYAAEGRRRGSWRAKRHGGKTVRLVAHTGCGNYGCDQCFPGKPWLAGPKPSWLRPRNQGAGRAVAA